nr:TetR/AcrR family transcriptional regulator [Sphingomonas sp. CDS-1]
MTDADGAPGLRERKKRAVRQAILEAAERLFRENGYDKTSMSDIAQAANISRKTLFNYVETKPAVVLGLVDAFVGEHMPEWLETDIPHFHDARDIMTPDVDVRLKDIAEHRWLLSLATTHAGFLSVGRTTYVAETLDTNVHARERRIAAVQRSGGMRADVPAHEISRYYEVLRDQAVHRWLLAADSTADDLHRLFHNAMDVLIRGLENRPD